MKIYFEYAVRRLNKKDEELCGDSMVISKLCEKIIFVLSDGLGSGVKASILSTMTAKIASHLLEKGLPIEEVVDTISQTLPICQIRKIAYSTFSISQFHSTGRVIIFEYDTPEVFFLRNRKVQQLPYEEFSIKERKIRKATVDVRPGDWLVFMSDGALNAGIGGVWSLGWGWNNISQFLQSHTNPLLSAQDLADNVAGIVSDLYEGRPGDDVSIAIFKVRKRRNAFIMSGPPENRALDEAVVWKLVNSRGVHIICGGTTSSIVSRILGRSVSPDLKTLTDEVPPLGYMEGIDLVTEGVLTLSKALEIIRTDVPWTKLEVQIDGASTLARKLLYADYIHFFLGRAINPAHQDPKLPLDLALKNRIIHELAAELRHRDKEVVIENF